jgi:hypothetical protein
MVWATAAEVTDITGETPAADVLLRAAADIELAVGRTQDATWIPARDLRWLKRAVAYQAAWLPSQPDHLTRSETTGAVIQDGAHVEVTKAGQRYAPLAISAMKRLTWRGNRSVHTESTLATKRGPYALGVDGVVSIFDYQGETWHQER